MQELNSNNKNNRVVKPVNNSKGTGSTPRPQGRPQSRPQNGPQKTAQAAPSGKMKSSDIPRPPKPQKAPKPAGEAVSISKKTLIIIACAAAVVIIGGVVALVLALNSKGKAVPVPTEAPIKAEETIEEVVEPTTSDNAVTENVGNAQTEAAEPAPTTESSTSQVVMAPESTQEILGDAKFSISNKYIQTVQREEKDNGKSVIIPIGTDKVNNKSKYTIEMIYTAGVISAEDINKYSAYVITKKLDELMFDPAICSIKSDILKLQTENGTEIRFKGTKFKDKDGEKATVFTNILTYSGDVYSVAFTIKSPDGTESSSQSYTDSLAELKSIINSFRCSSDSIQQVNYAEANEPEQQEVEIETKMAEPNVEYQDMITVEKDGTFLITSTGEGALYKEEISAEEFNIGNVTYSNAYAKFKAGTKVYAYNCKVQNVDNVKSVETSDHYFLLAGKHLKAGKHKVTGLEKGGYICIYDTDFVMNSKTSLDAEETEEIDIKDGFVAEVVNVSIK